MWYVVWLRLIFPVNIESGFGLAPDVDGIMEYLVSQTESGVTESVNLDAGAAPELYPIGVSYEVYSADVSSELYSADELSGRYSKGALSGMYLKIALSELYSTDIAQELHYANAASGLKPENTQETRTRSKPAFWFHTAVAIWLTGMVIMLGYMAVSYGVLRRKLRTAVIYEGNVWQSEFVTSPFIFGIISPRIYIPYGLENAELDHVLAHEKAHLVRKDHLTKLFAFIILGVYWFNPLVWLAYMLFCKDIEAACDEKTIAHMGEEERRSYALALLSIGGRPHVFGICPIGFGELGVKEGILRIKAYKKPAFILVFGAVLVCIPAAVCFWSSPKQEAKASSLPLSYYYYADYWAANDMSETVFPDKESLEECTSAYLKEVEEFLGCGEWWKEINPQAKDLQIT